MPWNLGDGGDIGNGSHGDAHITGGVRAKQGLYAVSTTQNYPLGYPKRFGDGRAYRYTHFSGAVGPGKLAAIDATSQDITQTAATAVRDSAGAAADVATGQETLYFLDTDKFTTAHSDDTLAGGTLHIINNSGGAVASEGHQYAIKSNTYTASTSVMQIDLYDATATALNSEDLVGVTGNPYKQNVIYNAAADDVISGVTLVDMAAAEYGWVQTWGVATCLMDGTPTRGAILTGADAVDGAVQVIGGGTVASEENLLDLTTEPVVGYALQVVTTAGYIPLYLQIAP